MMSVSADARDGPTRSGTGELAVRLYHFAGDHGVPITAGRPAEPATTAGQVVDEHVLLPTELGEIEDNEVACYTRCEHTAMLETEDGSWAQGQLVDGGLEGEVTPVTHVSRQQERRVARGAEHGHMCTVALVENTTIVATLRPRPPDAMASRYPS
jgi:hypothetical protein